MRHAISFLSRLAFAVPLVVCLRYPATYGADAVDVRDLPREASMTAEQYAAYVRELNRDYSQVNDQLRKIMAHKLEVPPPDTSGPMESMPIRIPLKAPWDVLSPLPDLSIGMQPLEEPRVKVSGKAEGSALFAKKSVQVSCQLADDGPLWQTKKEFTADIAGWAEDWIGQLPVSLAISGGKLDEIGGSFSVWGVSSKLGVRPASDYGDDAFEARGSVGTGIGTPSSLKGLFSASVKVDAEVSGLARLTDPVFGSPYGRQTLHGALVKKVEETMQVVFVCPQCNGAGELTCGTCNNTRTITCTRCNGRGTIPCPTCSDRGTVTCPRCNGQRNFPCGRCDGSGWVSCPTTQRCSKCGGTGWCKCMWCNGSGRQREEHSETRWRRVPRTVGFDDYGDPILEYYDEPYTYTWYTWETCTGCWGKGGETCSRCGGDGTVTCSICGGTGQRPCPSCGGDGRVDCRTCRGTGSVRCPTCKGKPLKCPVCKGKPITCPECKGKPIPCPFCEGKKSWGGGR